MKLLLVITLLGVGLPVQGWFFGDDRIDPHTNVTGECLNHAQHGSCEFFQCLEQRFPCGHGGFSYQIGLHFCRKMMSMFNELNASGKQWINGTSRCLTNKLMPLYTGPFLRCGDIRDVGADAMVTCNGRVEADGTDFCWFVRENSDFYQRVFEASDIGRLLRLRKPGVVAKLIVDAAGCGASSLRDRVASFTSSLSDLFRDIVDRIDEILPWD